MLCFSGTFKPFWTHSYCQKWFLLFQMAYFCICFCIVYHFQMTEESISAGGLVWVRGMKLISVTQRQFPANFTRSKAQVLLEVCRLCFLRELGQIQTWSTREVWMEELASHQHVAPFGCTGSGQECRGSGNSPGDTQELGTHWLTLGPALKISSRESCLDRSPCWSKDQTWLHRARGAWSCRQTRSISKSISTWITVS